MQRLWIFYRFIEPLNLPCIIFICEYYELLHLISYCHIFIKGYSKEDYDDFFRATGYIENTQEAGAVTSVFLCVIQMSVAKTM